MLWAQRCFIPPIRGAGQEHVAAVRRLADVQKICEMLPDIKSVCVIGGGVLGLEAAWEFRKSGRDVSVVEAAPGLMNAPAGPGGLRYDERNCGPGEDKNLYRRAG